MIVALLILIVLILLFGAGVVKGWLSNVVGLGCFGLVILAVLIWLGSFFGEHGFTYVVFGTIGVVMTISLVAHIAADKSYMPIEEIPPALPREPIAQVPLVKQAWMLFAADIEHRFDITAQKRAHDLYQAGDASGLRTFCEEELERINLRERDGDSPRG